MTLDDARIARYGRQILLPEVGGRGQTRLLGSAIAVVGTGTAAAFAASLIGRAGVGRLALHGIAGAVTVAPDCTVTRHGETDTLGPVDLAVFVGTDAPAEHIGPAVMARGTGGAFVAALPGRPCLRCFVRPAPDLGGAGADTPSWSLGALVAAEALRLLLQPAASARLHRLDDGPDALRTASLDAGAGCPSCAAQSV